MSLTEIRKEVQKIDVKYSWFNSLRDLREVYPAIQTLQRAVLAILDKLIELKAQ